MAQVDPCSSAGDTSQLSMNDLFHEIFDENKRLMDELSLNKRYVEVLQKFRQLLSSVIEESDSTTDIELRQQYRKIEDEFIDIEEEIKSKISETVGKTSELRDQLDVDSQPKEKRLKRSVAKKYVSDEEENMSATENNREDNENQRNVKFLSATDKLIEEDGSVVTERDPKNPMILVVRMNDSSRQLFGFRCNWSDCQYVSVAKAKVDTHLRTVHDRNGMFVCHKCRSKFRSQKLLSTHVNTDHSKQYNCDYDDCGFQCRTRQHLNDHLRRHTGEKPYVCAVGECGKAFATRQELRKHNNGVHSKDTHVCDWPGCEQTFKTQKGLTCHQKTHILC